MRLQRLQLLLALLFRDRQDAPAVANIVLGGWIQRPLRLVAARLGPAPVMGDEMIDFRLDLIFEVPQGYLQV